MNKYIVFSILLFIVLILIYRINDFFYIESKALTIKYKPKFIEFINTKLSSQSNKLFFIPHLELGDSIVLNGIIRYYCSIYDTVVMVCKKTYYNQIHFMYSDLENLILYKVSDKNVYRKMTRYVPYDADIKKLFTEYNIKLITLGCFKFQYHSNTNIYSTLTFPLWIYDDLQLSSEIAYEYFKINRDYKREDELYNKLIKILGFKYIIIIDDEKRKYTIKDSYITDLKYPVFKLGNNSTNINKKLNDIKDPIIFNYIKILENATEIISIDSSIPWLIDMLNIQTKTSVHTYMRAGNVKYNNKNISIINGTSIDRLPAFFDYNTVNSGLCSIFY
jgi:hypothetical protein